MNAKSEIMLIEMSVAGKKRTEPANEIGMPRVTQKAKRASRNNASVRRTREQRQGQKNEDESDARVAQQQ
jgi:hypothetical protein